jgi:hypothetical protein
MSEFHVYIVYWVEDNLPQMQGFGKNELNEMLKFSEGLRKRRHEDANLHHVTFCSEDPNCTSLLGVDVTGPDYDWKKRRC